MEKDTVPQDSNFTTSAQESNELFSSCNDDSKKFTEFASETQTELSVPEQVDALGNQEGSEDSIIQVGFNSRTSDSDGTDDSFEAIPESYSHKFTLRTRTLPCPERDDDSEQPDSLKLSITNTQFSSLTLDSTDRDESIEVIAKYSLPQESPVFHELNSKMSNTCFSTNDTFGELSRHQVHIQQSQNDELLKGNTEESGILAKETSKVHSLENEQMSAENCKSSGSTQVESITPPARMKCEFVPGLSVATTEQTNNVSEDLHDKNQGENATNAQTVVTGPSAEIITVPFEETLKETVRNFFNSKTSYISYNEQPAVQNPTICGQDMKNSESTVTEVKSGLKKSCHELHEELTKHAEHQEVEQKDGEIFKMELNGEEEYSNKNGTNAKKDKPVEDTSDKNVKLSTQNTFGLYTSTITNKCKGPKGSEIVEREIENANIAHIQQNLVTDSADENAEVILQKQPGETVEVAANTYLISDITQNTIQTPMFGEVNLNSSGRSSMTGTAVKPGLTESPDIPKRSKTSKVIQVTSALTTLIKEFDANQNNEVNLPCPAESAELITTESGSFYEMSNVRISEDHLTHLIGRMGSNHYLANVNDIDLRIYGYCKYLFEKDYRIKVVNNEKGTLCRNYPLRTIVPYERRIPSNGPKILEEVTIKSFGETCRDRFIAPTIFWHGKVIYRSAPFMVKESETQIDASIREAEGDPGYPKRLIIPVRIASTVLPGGTSETAVVMFGENRSEQPRERRRCRSYQQAELKSPSKSKECKESPENCRVLRITNLFTDLGGKSWTSLTAAEKVYQDSEEKEFRVADMRFPDCKFFRRYHEHRRVPLGLLYESDHLDLVDVTQSRLNMMLAQFLIMPKNLVMHCITGWDQTPLFIALLRISLWADGLIHASLNPHEMAYLTLGYDWYLSGHNLPARLKYGEEILHYCYKFLEYLIEDQFSAAFIHRHAGGYVYGRFERSTERIRKILKLKEIVLPLYDEHILKISR